MSPVVSLRGGRTASSRTPASRYSSPRRSTFSAVRRARCHDTSGICGLKRSGAQVTTRCVVADALGRYGRIACAAVVVLVLLGDNTSAGSSRSRNASFRVPRGRNHDNHHHNNNHLRYQPQQQSATAFASSRTIFRTVGRPGDADAAADGPRDSLLPQKASLGAVIEARRARKLSTNNGNAVPTAVAADSNSREFSAAHAFSVRRRGIAQGAQRLLFPPSGTAGAGAMGADAGLQSPRFAAAAEGGSYPERLQVSTEPKIVGAATSEAEKGNNGGFAEVGNWGRPALPELSAEELTQLHAGQRVQKQTRQGGSGSGSVVVDVRADPDVVLELLTKYDDYATMIDTVRQCEVFPSDSDTQRKVEVTVSRFRLHIRVLMTLIKDRNMVRFALDPDCTKAGRAVLREATGFFFVESPPDRPEYSRVWMLATIDVNRFVPGAIVDYAASRALPRASNWIKPTCEMAQRRKVRESMGKGVSGQ